MASIIPGYEYDIFISYRQKDNKGDRWVSEFVEALKTELESTFKEEISVYFDINPHDGLLETHDVDASLKDKLKCLVFIPIISRTYCDPKSFAWEHEFKAFVELASIDQFGLKVKLPNGNVANRVLPVRIYDLDNSDIKLCESILDSVLRGVEFIYKEPGVNRPLRANEENPQNNLNRTVYRNQINKVANAVKEIITAIGNHEHKHEEIQKEAVEPLTFKGKSNNIKIIAGSLILLALIVLGLLFFPKLLRSQDQLNRTIAVLPFINVNPSDTNNPIINGISRDISSNLQSIKDLSVVSQYSAGKYKDPSKYKIREIAKDLGVNYLVTGTGQKYGTNLILRVELIDAINDRTLWSKPYKKEIRETKDIFSIQSEIAQSIAIELKAVITPEEKKLIEKVSTTDLTAYDFYQRGREEHAKYQFLSGNMEALTKAEVLYKRALEYDHTFAQAYTGLAAVYWDKYYRKEYFSKNFMDSVLFFTQVALSYNDQLDEAYTIRGNYYHEKSLPEQAIKEFDKALKINPNSWRAYSAKAGLSDTLLILLKNLHKAASLNHGPELPRLLVEIAETYCDAGFMEKAKYYALEAFKLDGDSVKYFTELGYLEQKSANLEKSTEFLERSYDLDSTNIFTLNLLAQMYGAAGQFEKTLKYAKKFIARGEVLLGTEYFSPGATYHRIGYAYWKNGYGKESEYYFNKQLEECNNQIKTGRPWSQLYYTYYDIAGVYAFRGDKVKAYENLRIFNQRKVESLWMLSLIKNDPLFDSIRKEPEFQQIVRDVEAKYQGEHERVRKWLEENKML